MIRISFLNGSFLPHENCFVHIEDRGMQFADGVYEVILFKNGKLIDNQWHLERLFYSLKEIQISFSYSYEQITNIIIQLFEKNNLTTGSVYLQITRGVSPRNQLIPKDIEPTFIATVSPVKLLTSEELEKGFSVMTADDLRWNRCNVKSIGLLASTLTKEKADSLGYSDAILIRDNFITECTFSNVFIVNAGNQVLTHPLDNHVLPGITRKRLIEIANNNGITVVEQKFTIEELLNAKEVFSTSTTTFVRPILKVDGKQIGTGKTGEITQKLSTLYHSFIDQ